MRRPLRTFRTHVLEPFRAGKVPPAQLSRGAGIGLFLALLPVVGQLYFTPVVWGLLRPLSRLRFNLPLAMGMTLIVNPPVKVPLFYGYLLTGEALLAWAGVAPGHSSAQFLAAQEGLSQGSWGERLWAVERLLALAAERYALPLVVGGTVWALTLGALAGLAAHWAHTRRQRRTTGQAAPAEP